MAERSRREVKKHGQSKAAGALAQLAELRRTGKKQADLYELKEEEDLYDELDEDEYEQVVSKRREEGGAFVVKDGIDGYEDIGEEDDWNMASHSPMVAQKSKKSKQEIKEKAGGKGNKRKAEPAADEHRLPRMFAKHTGVMRMTAHPKNDPKTGQASDALLGDILEELGGSPSLSRPPQRRQLGGRALPAPPIEKPAPRPSVRQPAVTPIARGNPFRVHESRLRAAPRATPILDDDTDESLPMHDAARDEQGDLYGASDDPYLDADSFPAEDQPVEDEGPAEDHVKADGDKNSGVAAAGAVKHLRTAQLEPNGGTPKPDQLRRLQNEGGTFEGRTPKGPVASLKEEGRTPWKTPPPVFADPKTPATAIAASGWQEICSETGGGPEEPATEENEWQGDGSLPLNSHGALPFYFLDAHEEYSTPEIVYLFGKVPQKGSFLSCCLTVRGCQRTLFFVPKPGEIADEDGCLAELEAEAAADSSKRGDLMQYLHALTANVKAEVREALNHHGVSNFVIKPVKRTYAFEMANIPRCEQWVLKVKYPASYPQLPLGLTGKHFAGVLGTSQSTLEAVLLKRRIMGPSWISVTKPTRINSGAQVSWCKLEVEVGSLKSLISGAPEMQRDPPTLVVAGLSLKTAISEAGTSEIVAASVVFLNRVRVDRGMTHAEWDNTHSLRHFSIVRKLDRHPFPPDFENEVRRENESARAKRNGGYLIFTKESERELLDFLLGKLQELDADVYAGHNISGFDLDVLLHRLQKHKVANWSRLGRLKRSKFPNLSGGGHVFGGGASPGIMTVLAGRLLCDTYLAARELVKEVDYTLKTLSRSLLQQERSEFSATEVPGRFETSAKLLGLLRHTGSDAWLSLGLSFHLSVLPLTRQLSELSGSLWSRALQGQRAQRIEMLLLHEFYRRKFLLPDRMKAKDRERLTKLAAKAKQQQQEEEEEEEDMPPEDDDEEKPDVKKGKGPQYAGGLVLEPKKGLYDKYVLLLDFNSLYPSIIQEYNICFTTVAPTTDRRQASIPQPSSDLAPLPKVIQGLVQRRRAVKDALNRERDPMKRAQMNIRQQALKLTANSMYGCLGFPNSRFFARPLAELITSQGREILQSTVDLVQGTVGAEVIYGDTDSIMIASGSTNIEEVNQLGQRVKQEVNKRYKLLEIEVDGIFKCMLLLKKKKYAAIKLEHGPDGSLHEVVEQKGLDIVRRDWCPLSKDVGNFALEQILSGQPCEEVVEAVHAKLREVKEKMDKGLVPLSKFVITKQLTKRPQDYPDAHNQPHVQVALRRAKEQKQDGVAQGQTVPYIICVERSEDGQSIVESKKGLAERAHHLEEVNGNPRLTVDAEYYLAHQVHPVVSRLCAPIEGTDAARLADCLGLDPAKFRGQVVGNTSLAEAREEALLASASSLDDPALYKDCKPLTLTAQDGTSWEFKGISDVAKGIVDAESILGPPDAVGSGEGLSAAQLANQVQLRMREEVSRYYDSVLRSDDELMPTETRNVCMRTQGDAKPGTLPPDPKSSGQMAQVYTEAALYRQLSHFKRLLDAGRALREISEPALRDQAAMKLGPVRACLDAGAAAVARLQERSAYRWVDLRHLCSVPAPTTV